MMVVEASGLTDKGKERANNEDALLVDDQLRLYVVADGMGGHRAGEVASEVVVRSMSEFFRNSGRAARSREQAEDGDDAPPDPTLSAQAGHLLAGIRRANRAVYLQALGNDEWRGMGSTVAAVRFTDRGMIAANVGDSPIWLVHGDRIEMLSVAHTVLSEGLVPERGEAGRRFGRILTRAIGVGETVRADICEAQCFTGDVVVIGSDGLSNHVHPDEIRDVVRGESSASACRMLVDLANRRAGDDNITVIVIKVKDVGRRAGFVSRFATTIAAGLRRLVSKA